MRQVDDTLCPEFDKVVTIANPSQAQRPHDTALSNSTTSISDILNLYPHHLARWKRNETDDEVTIHLDALGADTASILLGTVCLCLLLDTYWHSA